MAVLRATSLTGCSSLPSFISSGTRMIFNMASAPVSWAKDTSVLEGTLRVTNSTASPSGSFPFSTIFAVRSAAVSVPPIGFSYTANTIPTVPITVPFGLAAAGTLQPFTLTLPTMRAHRHEYPWYLTASAIRTAGASNRASPTSLTDTGTNGSGTGHTHDMDRSHTHTIPSIGSHSHPGYAPHSHPASPISVDFRVNYVDMIICTKD